jgi:hypothetical protein
MMLVNHTAKRLGRCLGARFQEDEIKVAGHFAPRLEQKESIGNMVTEKARLDVVLSKDDSLISA